MSEMWIRAGLVDPELAEPAVVPFLPWGTKYRTVSADPADPAEDAPFVAAAMPEIDVDAIAMEAFAEGFAEGRRIAAEEQADERRAMHQLVAGLEALHPEPSAALAGLIAETVGRLVRQIVGDAPVDGELLVARAEAAAALVIDEAKPRLRISPADHARLADAGLGIELAADPALTPGTIVIETRDGWIEDGPQAGLARLAAQLDRMGVPR